MLNLPADTSILHPLDEVVVRVPRGTRRLVATDAAGAVYADVARPRAGLRVRVRGAAGVHRFSALDAVGAVLTTATVRMQPRTRIACDRGVYARYHDRVVANMLQFKERQTHVVEGRLHRLCVCWLRDHTYTLKALRHYWDDVISGTQLFLDRQQPDGMVWDDIHATPGDARAWFGEALGAGYFDYADDHHWVFRRIPVEADVEYILVEAVHHGWKASGDDAWMAAQLAKCEKAIAHSTSDPRRWSRIHRLVKRAYTMDSWDFKHPAPDIGGGGDHRLLAGKDQPYFLFHGDNSGVYAAHVRLAEMYAALGRERDAQRHRTLGDGLRERANRLLWKDPIYAHMVPERPIKDLKSRVGDDDQRISLSLPYTVNRGLPDHDQAVRIIDEYQRRRKSQARTSYAEWWAMDPMYLGEQWHDGNAAHQTPGEYMNGSISPLVAGELSTAAFEHGREAYGADILRRLWDLSEADGGHIHDCYRRLPPGFREQDTQDRQRPIDIRSVANVGLRNGQVRGVPAWTDEGDNDLRGLPVGRRRHEAVDFAVIDPRRNGGRAVVAFGGKHPSSVVVPVGRRIASFYALHALAGSGAGTVGRYVLCFADGTEHGFDLIAGRELSSWWGPAILTKGKHQPPANVGRIWWHGPSPTAPDVGVYVSGFTNPKPEEVVVAIRLEAIPGRRIMLCALSAGTAPARFPRGIRSQGLPSVWSQASIHHAVVQGLGGVVDTGRAFDAATISPRWAATEARSASVCVHYPASGGYCAYRWAHDPAKRTVRVDATGTALNGALRVLMPAGRKPVSATHAGGPIAMRSEQVEASWYAVFDALPAGEVAIRYR